MKQITIILILFIGLNTIAQVQFEKGYIINNDGEKISCLVKNEDWNYNPKSITYKIDHNSTEKKGNIETIKEFGINEVSNFKRFKINIDRSSTNPNKLSKTRLYNYNEETIFLKTLIEGNADLYLFKEGNLIKFFYKKNQETPIKQLEYKKYLNTKGGLAENNNYLTQLRLDLPCNKLDIKTIKYTQKSLVNFFLKYNNCDKNTTTALKNYDSKKNKSKFNLKLKVGMKNATITPKNTSSNTTKLESKGTNLKIGLEAELVLPFNKNKWSIYAEPTYNSFNEDIDGDSDGSINYKSIKIDIGAKHYMFLNHNSKLFLLGALGIDLSMDSKIVFNSNRELEISSGPHLTFGLGYNYKDKYSIETRYSINNDLTDNYSFWETKYSSFSIVFGYNFL
jgi:hypothetical protein